MRCQTQKNGGIRERAYRPQFGEAPHQSLTDQRRYQRVHNQRVRRTSMTDKRFDWVVHWNVNVKIRERAKQAARDCGPAHTQVFAENDRPDRGAESKLRNRIH